MRNQKKRRLSLRLQSSSVTSVIVVTLVTISVITITPIIAVTSVIISIITITSVIVITLIIMSMIIITSVISFEYNQIVVIRILKKR